MSYVFAAAHLEKETGFLRHEYFCRKGLVMEMDGPIRVMRNTFSYDAGLYRCTLAWDEVARNWAWGIAERVPAPPHTAEGVHVFSNISGNEETAEAALEALQTSLRRLEQDEEAEAQDKYAG